MSSLPGYKLEDFLAWSYNVVVVGQGEANLSLGAAEMLGTIPLRQRLTQEQFKELVELFEPWREYVEARLEEFDEETQSWRTYAGYCFDDIPGPLYDMGYAYIRNIAAKDKS